MIPQSSKFISGIGQIIAKKLFYRLTRSPWICISWTCKQQNPCSTIRFGSQTNKRELKGLSYVPMIEQGLWTPRLSKFPAFASIKTTIFFFKSEVKLKHWGWIVGKKKDQNLKSLFWFLFSLELDDFKSIETVLHIGIHYLTFTCKTYFFKKNLNIDWLYCL